jgi:hypothetical protein
MLTDVFFFEVQQERVTKPRTKKEIAEIQNAFVTETNYQFNHSSQRNLNEAVFFFK